MTFDRWTYAATILAVHDGDTVRADVDLGFGVHHEVTLRLLGIQAPEVSGPGVSPEERVAGNAARLRLAALLAGRPVYVTTVRDRAEGRGRYLARLWTESEDGIAVDVCAQLVIEGFATPYDGRGKAPRWTPTGWERPA